MKIFIFANCQGAAIGHLLKIAGYDNIAHQHNYTYIYDTTLQETTKNELETCDIFIYQPLSNIYPVYNTNNLKKYLKSDCISISFPYIYNDALIPLYIAYKRDIPFNGEYDKDGNSLKYGNIEIISTLKKKGYTQESIIEMYKDNKLDFNYEERFNKTLNILKNKEVETDIHISDFIEKNYKNYRLFNYHIDLEYTCCNHPSNILLIECTNQILHLLGKNSITYDGPELIPGNYYVTQYDINFFKFNWIKEESPEAFDYYKNIITKMYNIC